MERMHVKTLVIVTHPNIESSVWNKAWVNELKKHDEITIHELYKEYPDENIDVHREQQLVLAHDRIIFQYPLYWYTAPPLLKKWFENVLLYSWAYGPGGTKTTGKEIGVAFSYGAPKDAYQPTGSNHFTLEEILVPFRALANYISAVYLPHFAYNTLDETLLEQSSKDYVRHITTVKPLLV